MFRERIEAIANLIEEELEGKKKERKGIFTRMP